MTRGDVPQFAKTCRATFPIARRNVGGPPPSPLLLYTVHITVTITIPIVSDTITTMIPRTITIVTVYLSEVFFVEKNQKPHDIQDKMTSKTIPNPTSPTG